MGALLRVDAGKPVCTSGHYSCEPGRDSRASRNWPCFTATVASTAVHGGDRRAQREVLPRDEDTRSMQCLTRGAASQKGQGHCWVRGRGMEQQQRVADGPSGPCAVRRFMPSMRFDIALHSGLYSITN